MSAELGKTKKGTLQVANANLANPTAMLDLAGTVKQFIVEQKLYTAIQGRNYVNVEGWQFAGGMIGVLPISQGTQDLSTADEIKYKASVELLNIHTQTIVGAGFATCSNKESGKKYFAEYAIESMAQTRAVGKAYRLMLGWLMKAAGYESTPAEEMDFQNAEVVENKPKQAQAPPVAEAAPAEVVEYATAKQKEEVIKLLSNEHITKQEKTKMLLNINKLTFGRAKEVIVKLKATIEDRSGQPITSPANSPEAATEKQREHIVKLMQSHHFSDGEREEGAMKCESPYFSVAEAAEYIDQLHQAIKGREAREKAKAQAA